MSTPLEIDTADLAVDDVVDFDLSPSLWGCGHGRHRVTNIRWAFGAMRVQFTNGREMELAANSIVTVQLPDPGEPA